MKNAHTIVSHIINKTNIAIFVVFFAAAVMAGCDYNDSTGIAVRHLCVIYEVDVTSLTTASVYAEFRSLNCDGDLIELGGNDLVTVNDSVMSVQYFDDYGEEFYYTASIESSDRYTFIFRKNDISYIDAVDIPVDDCISGIYPINRSFQGGEIQVNCEY